MILLIDNYDSFTYNLYQYLSELGAEVEVVRNDQISLSEVELMQPEKGQWALFSPAALMRIQKIRESLGVPLFVNSAFRSPGYNAGIDDADASLPSDLERRPKPTGKEVVDEAE